MAIKECQELPFDSPDVLHAEIESLHHSLLPMFIYPLLAVPLIWLVYAVLRDWSQESIYLIDLAVIELILAIYIILEIYSCRYNLAVWILILSLSLGVSLLVIFRPDPVFASFGLVIVVVAQTLLGSTQSLLASAIVWLAVIIAWRYTSGVYPPPLTTWGMLTLYSLTWVTIWLFGRPLKTSVSWALAAWENSRQLLEETRERRAELYRTLRALEEATYRIERMNGELLVAQHQAEEARDQKARFVATVSHELRSPLNLILGYSRLMVMSPGRYGTALPPAYRADVATIYRNSQHLADMVDDILDLSQIEAERLPLVKDQTNLDEIINEALGIVRPIMERKGLYLHEQFASNLPTVLADRVRLRQVLLNILINAIRFTDRGGITVQTLREADRIVISVHDTGPGIASEKLSKIFQEFYQAYLPQRGEQRGSGLGLSISKYLIELHGGQIWAESQIGTGTTFYFTLPITESGAVPVGVVYTSERVGRSKDGYPCLIIHAYPDIIHLLARYLDGYRVVGVTNESGVIPLVRDLHPWAVVTASKLAEALRTQLIAQFLDVPVIGCVMPHTHEHPATTLTYLIKPINPDMVRAVMLQVERKDETTVLLIDDDPDAVRLMETLLMDFPHHYHILKAYGGLQALNVMTRIRPDIVFLDLLMPDLDGVQVLARMRADESLREVPVAIVSGRNCTNEAIALGMPFSVHATKPLSILQAVRWLKATLSEISPDYLTAPEAVVQPVVDSLY